ncbi:NnrS family protein [Granulosicoccus antarcticus]|uniref:NnrS protein n=1 Tax=Granulosicoccus antarcticus IMCC3135 TaxID=1192854 RepID=A0A2Z2P167_9GAMM|nr:NnrS family protein [Granulosicoccus antarcticus]ASJ76221.1 hypothetical protein IMCC3135_30860 [Granulosicoccus antarcticus IMCC3135]
MEPAQTPSAGNQFALWQLGFRPFYLLASIYAAASILLWAAQFAGWLPLSYLPGPVWHAHEMLFGFVLPVIVGFLLTAGQTWTGHKTLSGYPLMLLALVWVCARILTLTPYGWAAAAANAAFPWAAAIALAIPFVRKGVRRNYFFVGLLVLLGAASFGMHATRVGMLNVPARLAVQFSMDIVLFIMVVMAGRVVPLFTSKGVPGTQPQRLAWLEYAAPGAILVVLLADTLALQGQVLAVLLLIAALLQAKRLSLWQPWKTLQTPLVWVLHLAYGWIVLHLLLRGLAELDWITSSTATHALTVGAIGTLIMGMMTRTARGHTGRALKADRFDISCYVLIQIAAVVRVFLPLWVPHLLMPSVIVSAFLWSSAFGLYAIRYWPVLTRVRIDGRPG